MHILQTIVSSILKCECEESRHHREAHFCIMLQSQMKDMTETYHCMQIIKLILIKHIFALLIYIRNKDFVKIEQLHFKQTPKCRKLERL